MEENVWNALKPNGVFMICSVISIDGIKEMFSYYGWRIQCVGEEKMESLLDQGPQIYFYHLIKPKERKIDQ
jgi:hypothetical protein